MTNPRTLRLVTALVEQYPEFREKVKPEWFSYPPYGSELEPTHAPDLTDRRNLADLFDVCAFLGYVRTSAHEEVTAKITTPKEVFFVGRKTLVDALLSAAEAALGLEPWEEVSS